MDRLRHFATWPPYQFSALVTLLALIFYIMAAILAAMVCPRSIGSNFLAALGGTVGAGVFVFIMIKVGWEKACGRTRWGTLWSAIAIHSFLNASVAIVELNTPSAADPTYTLIIAKVLQLPVLLGLYLIYLLQPKEVAQGITQRPLPIAW